MKPCKLAAALAALLLAAGCADAPRFNAVTIYPSPTAELESPYDSGQDPAAQTVATGANDFALRLSAQLVQANPEENFVFSPYSVWLPLAALQNAADETCRDALLEALGASGMRPEDVNRAASRMLYTLTKQGDRAYDPDVHNPLRIANAVFVDRDLTLQNPFAQVFSQAYSGQAMGVDFSSGEAVDAVNAWAARHTDGLIPEIIRQFDPNTVAAIANAIYFSDRWDWEFDPDKTAEDIFYALGGEATAQYMLREGMDLPYYEDERLQAMPLRFKSGSTLYILLPKDADAAGLLAAMDTDYLTQIRQGTESATGKLLLPRFRIESGVMDLREALEVLGVPLFQETGSPLSGLIEQEAPVFLSTAVHRAVIEVDEKGTTAAAVTVMAAEAGAAPPEPTKPFEMICDHPFVFLLCGHTYDGGSQILFTGVVNRPEDF